MSDFEIYNGDIKKLNKMFRHDNIILVFVILLAILIGILSVALFVFYHKQQNSDFIQSGVYIKGIDVSGLTRDEAHELLETEINGQLNDHLELKYNNYNYCVELEQFEAAFDIDSSIEYALNIAKTGKIFSDLKEYIDVRLLNVNIEPELIYDDDLLTYYLQAIETYLPDQLEQSDYYIEDDELIVVSGVNGAGILYDELKEKIIDAIQDISYANKYIEIPTYTQYPDPIDVDVIHDEIYKESENAYFTTEPYAVFADVTGVDFDVEKLKSEIEENPDKSEYSIDLDYSTADVTVNDLGMEAFPDLLSTFSTKYTNNEDRTTNLRLASNKINGTVIMPGEEFSYNKVVGKRTIEAGYKEAAIYENGQVTSGLAGGICQISTTLYDAVVGADLEVTVRRNHMFVPSYVTAGKDATVVWGSQDFKFKNNRDYPIKIESSVSGGIAKISIYGLKTDNEYDSIVIESTTVKSTDSSLVVDAYRVYRKDGEVVKKEKIGRDTYSKHQ